MKQYEPCIQNDNNNNNIIIIIIIIIIKGKKSIKKGRENINFNFLFSSLFSQIYKNRITGFCRD